MRRLTLAALAAAAVLTMTAPAGAHPRELPDVRATADLAVTFYTPGWQGAYTLAPDWRTTDGEWITFLCDGYRPSDLEAWDIATGRRMGDDRLAYLPIAPGFGGVIVSRFPNPVRVWGWCG